MKNKKLKLNALKVQSFVTSLGKEEKQTLKEINGGLDVGSFACANSVGGEDICQLYPSNASNCGPNFKFNTIQITRLYLQPSTEPWN